MSAFGGGGLGWAAGVGQADLATGGQGPAGLAGLVGQQPTPLSGIKESLIDLVLIQGAGGDQVVEVAGRLPELAVALADRGGGEPAELLNQRRAGIPILRTVADTWGLDSAGQPLEVTMAGSAAALGALLHVCELWMAGQLTAEQANESALSFVQAGLAALDLI